MTERQSNMGTAPRDGTHVLIRHKVLLFGGYDIGYVEVGTTISECYFDQRWRIWTGTERISTTEAVVPISWAPIPEELL